MSVRKFRPRLRLSAMIREPGGILARDAVARADAALEAMRDDCVSAIDVILAQLSERQAQGRPLDDEAFDQASALIDASAAARELLIEEAARSLCRLLDVFREAGREDRAAVDVHLQALVFLRAAGDIGEDERRAMVRGLARVVEREALKLGVDLAH